jgi:CRISPR/Cas system-associated exonuclease Cas4 (RecB family)
MLVEKIIENKQAKIRLRPCHTNRASSLGHVCERKLVFDRTRWQDATPHDVGLQFIFDEGHLQETQVLKDLADAGWHVIDQQRDYEWKEYQITAHLDGKIVLEKAFTLEIKSMNPYTFTQIQSAQDIIQSRKHYIRAYAAQGQIYMLLSNSVRMVFIFKNKSTGQLKEIWMDLDYQFAEELIQKAVRINKHVNAGTIPDSIPWNEDICGRCAFAHICLPEARRDALDLTDDPELELKLKRRHELAPLRKEYEELDDEVKSAVKEKSKVVVGDFLITGKFIEPRGKPKYWKSYIQLLQIEKGASNG